MQGNQGPLGKCPTKGQRQGKGKVSPEQLGPESKSIHVQTGQGARVPPVKLGSIEVSKKMMRVVTTHWTETNPSPQ